MKRSLHVVALAVVLAAIGCGNRGDGAKKERPPVSVTVADATTGDVPLTVSAIGTVVPLATVAVQARVSGQITALDFKEGQMVQKGQVLFEIDAAPYAAALAQAEAVLARDTVQAEQADADAARYTQLVAQKLVSPSDAEAKVAGAKALRSSVAADKAAVDTAKLNLSWTRVTSPVTGRTDKRMVDVGNLVQPALPNGASVVVTIRQISPIQVQLALPQDRLIDVQERMKQGPVEVTASIPEHADVVEKGVLSFVGSAVDGASGTVPCKADFENKDERLWPGAYVQVTVALGARSGAVVVPSSAVLTGQQGLFAFVVKGDSTVEMRPVTSGPQAAGLVVIESGVKSGETVVVDGQIALVPGAKVSPKPAVGSPAPARAAQ